MRNAVFVLVGSLFLLAALPSALSGCGDSCEDLQEICNRCTDATYRGSCDSTVDQGNQSLCDARKTVFNEQCPFVLTTSSTTTAAATGGGALSNGGSAGAPSTGGAPATGGAGGTPATGGAGGTAGAGGN